MGPCRRASPTSRGACMGPVGVPAGLVGVPKGACVCGCSLLFLVVAKSPCIFAVCSRRLCAAALSPLLFFFACCAHTLLLCRLL